MAMLNDPVVWAIADHVTPLKGKAENIKHHTHPLFAEMVMRIPSVYQGEYQGQQYLKEMPQPDKPRESRKVRAPC